jgi:hypothetical protein
MMVSGAYYNLYGSGLEHKGGYNGGNPEHADVLDNTHDWEPNVIYPPYAHDALAERTAGQSNNREQGGGYGVGGSQILIWNVCDTSRIKAAHVSYVAEQAGVEYTAECAVAGVPGAGYGSPQVERWNYHGPYGVWHNGAALDYYGTSGYAMSSLKSNPGSPVDTALLRTYLKPCVGSTDTVTIPGHAGAPCLNKGMFRLFLGVRGDLRRMSELSLQTNAEGDITLSALGEADTLGGTPMSQLNAQGYLVPNPAARALWVDGSLYGTQTNTDSNHGQHYTPGDSVWRHSFAERNSQIKDKGEHYEVWGYGNYWESGGDVYKPTGTLPNIAGGGAGDAPFGASSNQANDASAGVASYSPPKRPMHSPSEGFLRNWLDHQAADLFANAKHLANPKVGGVSIYLSHSGKSIRSDAGNFGKWLGGESTSSKNSTHGVGVRSLNMFDLNRLL